MLLAPSVDFVGVTDLCDCGASVSVFPSKEWKQNKKSIQHRWCLCWAFSNQDQTCQNKVYQWTLRSPLALLSQTSTHPLQGSLSFSSMVAESALTLISDCVTRSFLDTDVQARTIQASTSRVEFVDGVDVSTNGMTQQSVCQAAVRPARH